VSVQGELDKAVQASVRERMEGDEHILDWSEAPEGEFTVRLVCDPVPLSASSPWYTPGAGHGRFLSFLLQEGHWNFLDAGAWVS
jgi:hypothetical protein